MHKTELLFTMYAVKEIQPQKLFACVNSCVMSTFLVQLNLMKIYIFRSRKYMLRKLQLCAVHIVSLGSEWEKVIFRNYSINVQ
jgi:hypothetical protein